MAKTKRRKTPRRKAIARPIAPQLKPRAEWKKSDLMFMLTTATLGTITMGIAAVSSLWMTTHPIPSPSWLVHGSITLSLVIASGYLIELIQLKNEFNDPNPTAELVKKTRRHSVWVLSLNVFLLFVTFIPILHKFGYILQFTTWLSGWLPSKHKISENLSLVMAFSLGAILSGVIGNLAYDVLKFIVRKVGGKV